MKLSRSKFITIHAALCALVMLFVLVPISIGPLQLAFIPIIAVIVSAHFLGVKHSLFTGLFFGIVSLVNHLIAPRALSPLFYNPAVSILPRILIGVSAYFATKGIQKISKKIPDIVSYAVGAVAGVITNTIGVLGMMLVFYYGRPIGSTALTFEWVAGVIVTNSILEIVLCTIIAPPVVIALRAAFKIAPIKSSLIPSRGDKKEPVETIAPAGESVAAKVETVEKTENSQVDKD